jgi:hypothetical protein
LARPGAGLAENATRLEFTSVSTSLAPLRRWSRAARVAAGIAGAWLLPLITHALGADFLLVLLIPIAAASLVRSGQTMLDQLVVAVSALFGTLCVAGLAVSFLPGGPHPVVLAGTAGTALVVLAASTGRRPALRWRLRAADWTVVVTAGAVAVLVLRQFLKRNAAGRLALLAPGEDLARHFVLFDAIGKLDGYAFLRPEDVAAITPREHAFYPQGWHFTLVVLDRFFRSDNSSLVGPQAMDWFVWANVGTFAIFAALVLWATRRLAGPRLTGPVSVVVLGGVAAYLFFGDPVTILLRGFPNELAALGFVAVMVALLARPLRSTREQVLTIAALGAALGFTYYLFLPVVAIAGLGWLYWRRRELASRPFTLAAGVVLASAATLPMLTNPVANRGEQFLLPGTAIPVERQAMLVLLAVAVAGLATRIGRIPGPWRIWAATAAGAVALAGVIVGYQYLKGGSGVPYYGEKAFHLVVVVGMVGMGASAYLLGPLAAGTTSGMRRLQMVLAPSALVVVALALVGAIGGPPSSSEGGSYGMGLLRGREGVRPDGPAVAYWTSEKFPDGQGTITVDLSHGPWANFYGTLYGISMQRTYVSGVAWYAFLLPGREPRTIADLERRVLESDRPVRFVVSSPRARFLVVDASAHQRTDARVVERDDVGDPDAMTNLEAVRYLADRYPDRVEVVTYPG